MVLTGGGEDVTLVEPSDTLQACLEPYDNLFRIPGTMMAELKRGFAGMTGYEADPIRYTTAISSSDPQELKELQEIYVPEPGLIYPYFANSTGMFNGSLVITLDNGFSVEIPTEELYNPVRGIAKDGSRVVNRNFTELAVYQDEAPEDAAVLGKVFLSRVYLYVDYDAGEFTLSLAATEGRAGSILVLTGDGDCGDGDGGRWSSIMKGFVALVVILGVALVTVLALWLLRRRKRGSEGKRTKMPWTSWRRRAGEDKIAPIRNVEDDRGVDGPEWDDGSEPRRRSSAFPPPMTSSEQPMVETTPDLPPVPILAAQQQRQASVDTEEARPPGRVDSTGHEVLGSSARDHPISPDGRYPELHGQQTAAELDSPRPDRFGSDASSSLALQSIPSTSANESRPVVGSNPAANFAQVNFGPSQESRINRTRHDPERRGG
jgi:hypothetical protein